MRDVAESAGVSFKTVSRVINNDPAVAPETRVRVESAIASLGYVPNLMARSLKSGVADSVGVIVDSIADPFFAALVGAVEEKLVPRNVTLFVGSTLFDEQRERDLVTRMIAQFVHGLVVAPVGPELPDLARLSAQTEVVVIDRPVPGYDSVFVDDHGAAASAMDQFLRLGHRRIALIGRDDRLVTFRKRFGAYRDALAAAGIAFDERLVPDPVYGTRAAAEATRRLLDMDSTPTAIFAISPLTGMGVAEALHRCGRTDIALISFGDFPLAGILDPAISCIDHDPSLVGRYAVDRLFELFDGSAEPTQRCVSLDLLRRGSGELASTGTAGRRR